MDKNNNLPIKQPNQPPATQQEIDSLIERTKSTLVADMAPLTHLAYEKDWKDFQLFTKEIEQNHLPALDQTTVLYLQFLVDRKLKINTIRRRFAAIRYYHHNAGLDSPTEAVICKKMMRAVTRQLGSQVNQKKAMYIDDLKKIIDSIDDSSLTGKRDKAMLLLGFSGGFRRSEVVSLDRDQLHFIEEHLRVYLKRSKTDQAGKGLDKPIFGHPDSPYCAVKAIKDWLEASGIESGPVFRRIRRGQQINLNENKALSAVTYSSRIKHYCATIGLDASEYSGHSLRSGFVTSAAIQGKDVLQIADITKQDIRTVQHYMRKAKMFEHHAGEDLWD
ncbi:MAG: tyrosine-type recombinase/integrase [Thiotrichaceae bacterium]|nr:tyrosine-type recombinase/integrase [Thiotrichaceae bacterium]